MPNAKIIPLIDLTYLPDTFDQMNDEKKIRALCESASSALGTVAALCVHPRYIAFTKLELTKKGLSIPVATVVNFSSGDESLESVLGSIKDTLEAGADEIDIVMPYKTLQEGKIDEVRSFLQRCKNAITEGVCMKVIIESGVLDADQVREATEIVCDIEADFVKTSTGKIKGKGATIEALITILDVLVDQRESNGQMCGLKLSGGITLDNVDAFLDRVQMTMGKAFIDPMTFRFGASALLDDLIAKSD